MARSLVILAVIAALVVEAVMAAHPPPPAQRGLCVGVAIDGARLSVCAPDTDAIADTAAAFVADHRVANAEARADLALALSRMHRSTARRSHAAAARVLCAAAAGRFAHNPTCHVAPRTLPGFAMYTHDPAECAHVSADIISDGVWEIYKSARFTKLLGARARSLVVDVGANIGWYSLLAANLGHRVIAFEPAEYNAELLRASAWANGFDARPTASPTVRAPAIDLRRVALADAPRDGVCLRATAGQGHNLGGSARLDTLTETTRKEGGSDRSDDEEWRRYLCESENHGRCRGHDQIRHGETARESERHCGRDEESTGDTINPLESESNRLDALDVLPDRVHEEYEKQPGKEDSDCSCESTDDLRRGRASRSHPSRIGREAEHRSRESLHEPVSREELAPAQEASDFDQFGVHHGHHDLPAAEHEVSVPIESLEQG